MSKYDKDTLAVISVVLARTFCCEGEGTGIV